MVKTINIENEPLIYFLIYMKIIVYIGETATEFGKRIYQHKKDKKFDEVKCISSKKLSFLKNEYFRKYYELRWINKFKPKYNKEKTKAPSLNLFLLKMFLWFENPKPHWLVPLSTYSPFMQKKHQRWLPEHKNKNSGKLYFQNVKASHDNCFKSKTLNTYNKYRSNYYNITPKENLLVLFPGWLDHLVESNNSNENRISISFNTVIE